NMAASLMLSGAAMGVSVTVAAPPTLQIAPDILTHAQWLASHNGATIEVTTDAAAAVKGADAIYTDVWTSMGQEVEYAERKKVFQRYQVNEALMARAKSDAIFMHCLPAHRGEEVTEEVIESAASVVFDQAENRLHAQKALLLSLIADPT
ncbi:MAG: ornithine carbamoyltransferase, partial [Acidobacteria bacterium]|nr:ornithine carbamoyltransferase [Acidobacteriota bacterium]